MPAFRLSAPDAPDALAGPAAFAAALRHDYGSYLLSLGLINLGNVLLLPVITAYLSPEDLGLYSLVETTMIQGITFSLLGLKFAYLYYYAHTPVAERAGLFGSTLLLAAMASLTGGLLLWALFGNTAIMACFDTTPLRHAWLMIPLLMLGAMQTLLMTELRAARRAWLSGGIAVAQLALTLLGSLLLVAVFGFGLTGLLLAQLVTGLLVGGIALALMRNRIAFRWQPRQIKALLHYGIPMMGSLLLRYSLDTACRFLLAALVSIEAAGTFLVANSVASVFDGLLALPFFTAWGGLVHHALRQPAAATIVGRATGLAITLGSLLVLVILAARPWLFDILAHHPMPDTAALFTLLLLSKAVLLVRSPLTSGILATGRTGWATSNSLLGLVVFLALLYPLAQSWQAAGMAAALLIANTVATLVLALQARRHCRPRINGTAWLLCGLAAGGGLLGLTPAGWPAILAALLGAALIATLLTWRHPADTEPV